MPVNEISEPCFTVTCDVCDSHLSEAETGGYAHYTRAEVTGAALDNLLRDEDAIRDADGLIVCLGCVEEREFEERRLRSVDGEGAKP